MPLLTKAEAAVSVRVQYPWGIRLLAFVLCITLNVGHAQSAWAGGQWLLAQRPPMPRERRYFRPPPVTPPPPPARSTNEAATVVQPSHSQIVSKDSLKTTKFNFDFAKAEVLDVVKAISDITRQNFIIPERIKGQRLTILSPMKITAAEASQVFYTALAVNGITVIRVGQFLKLVESRDAMKDVLPTCIDGEPGCTLKHDQMVTEILHIRHIDVNQISNVLKSLLSKDGDINLFAPNNALILSEYAPNLARLRRIIAALDIPNFDDKIQLVQIQYSAASEIAEKITQIFEVQGQARSQGGGVQRPVLIPPGSHVSSGAEDTDVQISKIVPDERTNQLIIKANKRSFEAVRRLIARLDVPISESDAGRVHVYYLENAKSEELATTLSSLASGQPTSKVSKAASQAAAAAAASQPGGNRPPFGGGSVGSGSETASLFEGDVKITADKATNSLLIMSSAHDYRSLRGIIEKLDIPRRQVYVEAAILEVDLQTQSQIGANFHVPIQLKEGSLGPLPVDPSSLGAFLQSSQNGQSPSPTFLALANLNYLLAATGGAVGGIFGAAIPLTLADGTPFNLPAFGVVLKWLQTSTNTNVLSTPHILTTDNEQAHIEVGQKIPFNSGIFSNVAQGGAGSALSALSSSTGSSALSGLGGGLGSLGLLGGLNSVQRIDVSLKLTLTPQINEANRIRLEIDQSVEDVIGGPSSNAQTPSTSHRALKTVVMVEDQQTVVLGGLIRDRTTYTESKVPYLGDVPVLGYLFKSQTTNVEKVNLLLVLTPYIIGGPDDFQRIFERKIREHDEFAAQYYGVRSDYRAHIDYTKKQGPLGHLERTLRRERSRYENGGNGDGSETLVAPDGNPDKQEESRDSHAPSRHSDEEAMPLAPDRSGPDGSEPVPMPSVSPAPMPPAAEPMPAPTTPTPPEPSPHAEDDSDVRIPSADSEDAWPQSTLLPDTPASPATTP